MVKTLKYDLDTDTTLGGSNASDYIASSQKAIKDYVDNHSGGGTATDVQINGTSITANNVANIKTNGTYNATSNKIATMSDVPTVNNATLTIQKNGTTVNTFTANASSNVTANITVPTDLGDLTNNAGYTKNVGTVTKVNNTSPDSSGNVTISIPAAQVQSNWNETNTSSKSYIQNKPTIPSVGNGTITITQGGTTKGTFTTNQSGNATIALDAGSSVDIDNSTITENTSNQIQTVAVKDNRSGNALKLWTGTKAQYDAISTKDSNTLYNITDDQDITLTLLQIIYPVGSVYLSTNATCPLASLFGTWTLVSSGKALWTGTGSNGGSTIDAGLPNITGTLGLDYRDATTFTGAFSLGDSISQGFSNDNSGSIVNFNASNSNSIYGNSTTVQPPAYVVNVWRRTA